MMKDSLTLQYKNLTIDMLNYRVNLGDEQLILAYREYALLEYLATHAGHVVSKRRLLEEGMGRHDVLGLRVVDETVRHLKSKIEASGEVFIKEEPDGFLFTGVSPSAA
jgi:DNA-binding response OmpR family regulator